MSEYWAVCVFISCWTCCTVWYHSKWVKNVRDIFWIILKTLDIHCRSDNTAHFRFINWSHFINYLCLYSERSVGVVNVLSIIWSIITFVVDNVLLVPLFVIIIHLFYSARYIQRMPLMNTPKQEWELESFGMNFCL